MNNVDDDTYDKTQEYANGKELSEDYWITVEVSSYCILSIYRS